MSFKRAAAGLFVCVLGILLIFFQFGPGHFRKLYIIPILVAPVLIIIGIWTLLKSMYTPFCVTCRRALEEKTGEYPAETEGEIRAVLESTRDTRTSTIRLVSKEQSGFSIILNSCPTCVAVGEVRFLRTRPRQEIFKKDLAGSDIRRIKERLFL